MQSKTFLIKSAFGTLAHALGEEMTSQKGLKGMSKAVFYSYAVSNGLCIVSLEWTQDGLFVGLGMFWSPICIEGFSIEILAPLGFYTSQ